MRVSVVLVTYRRLKRINEIAEEWLRETGDVWVCDCSQQGARINPKIKVVHAYPDPGNRIRHAVATMAIGDLVIKADDDVMPRKGIVSDFVRHSEKYGPGIYGIHGRLFNGPDYYHNTRLFGSKQLKSPQQVDFVGVMTCTSRQFLPMDLRDCRTEVEDLYWQMVCYPKARKWVIVTDKFAHLQESKDAGRLCGVKTSKLVRNHFYQHYYNKLYKK